jgi:two-component system response regulator MprA
MSDRPKILVVDDEPAVLQALSRAFALESYEVAAAGDGAEALEALAGERFDAVVLDVMMPGVSGLEVCRRLRASGDRSPVLMLTARDAIDDRVAGLDAGADDYLVKPFALRELQARVRALLRRSQSRRDVLGYADLTLDATSRKVTRDGQEVALTRIEFGLLELLLRNAEQVLSYDVIMELVWGYGEAPASNALTVFVGFLRRKLEPGGRSRLLHNVRGVGYVIRAES